MASKKGKARLKTIIIPHKTMPLTTREPYTNMEIHACQNELINDTCNMLPIGNPFEVVSFLFRPSYFFPSFHFSCFSFLDPKLECSKKALSDQE